MSLRQVYYVVDIFTWVNYLGGRVHDRVGSFGIGWSRPRFNNVLDRKCFHGVRHKLELCFVFQRQAHQGTRLLDLGGTGRGAAAIVPQGFFQI